MAKKIINEKTIQEQKEEKEAIEEERKKISFKDFWEFFTAAPVLGLLIGITMADSVSKLVSSIVNGFLTPLVSLIIPSSGVEKLVYKIGNSEFRIGEIISSVLQFAIMSIIIYILIRGVLRKDELLEYTKIKKAKVSKKTENSES